MGTRIFWTWWQRKNATASTSNQTQTPQYIDSDLDYSLSQLIIDQYATDVYDLAQHLYLYMYTFSWQFVD
jgi:hypothetical protein